MQPKRTKLVALLIISIGFSIIAWTQFNKLNTTFSPSLGQDSRQPTNKEIRSPANAEHSAAAAKIPFVLTESNNISEPVIVNHNDTLNLMFHTAVDSVSITNDALSKLDNFKTDESVEVQSWGGRTDGLVSKGNHLKLGAFEWNDQTIFVDEFSAPGTDGKFGPNLFKDKIIEVNFDDRQLVIHAVLPPYATDATSKFQRVEFSVEKGSMYVTGDLHVEDQNLSNKFMVHSGFSGTAILDDAFVREHQFVANLPAISQRELKDAFGNVVKTKKVILPSLRLGNVEFENVPVEIFDSTLEMQKISIVGGDILKRFNMIIDSANHQLYLSPSRLFGEKFGE
jgi:hypothetical protein